MGRKYRFHSERSLLVWDAWDFILPDDFSPAAVKKKSANARAYPALLCFPSFECLSFLSFSIFCLFVLKWCREQAGFSVRPGQWPPPPKISECHARKKKKEKSQNVIVRASNNQKVDSVQAAPFYSQFVDAPLSLSRSFNFWVRLQYSSVFLCPVICPYMSEDHLNARSVQTSHHPADCVNSSLTVLSSAIRT